MAQGAENKNCGPGISPGNMTANIITGLRILCSLALLVFPLFTWQFYVLYIAAGVTDMIDGAVARKTNTVSAFGSAFDTAADIVMVAVCLFRFLPVLKAELWMILWTAGIALIKLINVISGFIVQKKYVSVHSVMNKITGAMLFLFPLTLRFIDIRYSAAVICAAATAAALQEGHMIRTGVNCSNQKGISIE